MFKSMKLSRRAALAGMSASAFALATGRALAQAMGIATMQPGTLNHTTGSAIAKVLKEKAGINALVQPTAGEAVLIPMVGRGEAELGIANMLEVVNATSSGRPPAGPSPHRFGPRAARRVLGAQGPADEDDRRPQGQARAAWAFPPCARSTCW